MAKQVFVVQYKKKTQNDTYWKDYSTEFYDKGRAITVRDHHKRSYYGKESDFRVIERTEETVND